MNQSQARQLARELNREQGGRASGFSMPWIAITKDHFSGRWERTNEWGVMQGRMWFDHDPRTAEQPGPDSELASNGIDWGEAVAGGEEEADLVASGPVDEFPPGYHPRTGQKLTRGEAHP